MVGGQHAMAHSQEEGGGGKEIVCSSVCRLADGLVFSLLFSLVYSRANSLFLHQCELWCLL